MCAEKNRFAIDDLEERIAPSLLDIGHIGSANDLSDNVLASGNSTGSGNDLSVSGNDISSDVSGNSADVSSHTDFTSDLTNHLDNTLDNTVDNTVDNMVSDVDSTLDNLGNVGNESGGQ